MPLAAVAGIGAIGSIVGGITGASAAKKAAALQSQKEQEAIDFAKSQAADAKNYQVNATNEQRGNIASWINSGRAANDRLTQLMGLTPQGAAPIAQPLVPGATTNAAALAPGGAGAQVLPRPATGPMTAAYSKGGIVSGPGTSTSDSIPAHLSTGEGVLNAAAMKMPGVANMVMHLNRMASGKAPKVGGGHYDTGGIVTPPGPTGVMTPAPPASGMPPVSNLGGFTAVGSPASTSTPANPLPPGLDPNSPDPTLRTISTAVQGGVNMNSLPGGQTAWNEQPNLMRSLNIGPNGQMTAAGMNPSAMTPAGGDGGSAQPFGSLTQPFGEAFQNPSLNDTTDPGYAARLKLGTDAIERSAAARGGLLSGGTAKALSDYGQNFASQEYQNVYDRAHQNFMDRYGIFRNYQSDLYNRLMGISNAGETGALGFNNSLQQGAGNVGGIDMNAADMVGRDLTNQGAANASGVIGAQNAWNGAIGGITNAASLYALLRRNGPSPSAFPSGGMGAF